ncbi:MAG: GDP-mannose 4,6-dehydratase [Acidobacteriota bacterium]|nr:GDP-mannose 4,6-dehydratase [Acidobacteriota bacterium]
MKRVLVTGAEGFVGGRLVPRLVARGAAVIACHAPGTVIANDDDAGARVPVERITLDIRDRDTVDRVFRDTAPDAVVHLAGLSDVQASWRRIDDYYRVNVEGSENIVSAARDLSATCRLVVASSAEVYGPVPEAELPVRETRGLEPGSPYAVTKAAAERLSLPLGAIVVRSFNLIGPGQGANFALPSFATQVAAIEAGREEPVLRVGNLTPRRDFVHVDDGADAYALLLECGEPGSVYNVARGEAIELESALTRLIRLSGLEVEIRQDPDRIRPADVPVMCGDASRLRALGWRPKRSFDQALEAIWEDARRRLP